MIISVLSVLILCEINIKRVIKVRIVLDSVKQARGNLFKTVAVGKRD